MAASNDLLMLAQRYLKAIEQGATGDVLAVFFTPDVVQEEFPNRLVPNGARRDLTALLEAATHGQQVLDSQRFDIQHAIVAGNCVALETRTPVPGVLPNSPASNDWQPGFMTDLMLKDLGLALDFGKAQRVPLLITAIAEQVHRLATNQGYGRKDFSSLALTIQQLAEVQ